MNDATHTPEGAFGMPKFDIPKLEVPAAFRDFAEKSIGQARENYDRVKAAAEEATSVLEDAYATASKGMTDYGLKVIEATRYNTNASFDFAVRLLGVRSLSEAVEITSAHARQQFEALSAQTKELAALAQKVTVDSAEPFRASVSKASKIAA